MANGNAKGEIVVEVTCAEDWAEATITVTGSGRQAIVDLAEAINTHGGEYAPKINVKHLGEYIVSAVPIEPTTPVGYALTNTDKDGVTIVSI